MGLGSVCGIMGRTGSIFTLFHIQWIFGWHAIIVEGNYLPQPDLNHGVCIACRDLALLHVFFINMLADACTIIVMLTLKMKLISLHFQLFLFNFGVFSNSLYNKQNPSINKEHVTSRRLFCEEFEHVTNFKLSNLYSTQIYYFFISQHLYHK